MVWTFLCSKIPLLRLPIPESSRTRTSEVLFFPQITFWRYKHESAMLLDPGHNRGYGYRVSAEKNMAALNHSTHIDRSC